MTVTPLPPSGEQFELVFGDQRATVVEVGGGLRTYAMGDRDALDGYDADTMCAAARGQVLMPWPNRVTDGRYSFAGSEQQLPITEVSSNTAIHGLVRWSTWTADRAGAERVVMRHRLMPQPGYPFALDLSVAYALADDGLTVTSSATNIGDGHCPFGAGFHPYLAPRSTTIDDAVLRVPARDPGDFLAAAPVGGTVLDTCFTGLERDGDGRARVEFSDTVLWVDEAFGYLMVFTGDTLGPDERRRGLAVEPMTCAPDAFNTGDGLLVLEPGATWTGAWGIVPGGGSGR